MKFCSDCSLDKAPEEFPRNKANKDGLGTYCKPCHNTRSRESKERRGGSRRYHLKRRYGITPEEFEDLVERQGGLCMICLEAEPTHVDHDHKTGLLRGALCVPCNNGLGLFRDLPDRLERAADYLRGNCDEAQG